MNCPACGTHILPDQSYCRSCGADLNHAARPFAASNARDGHRTGRFVFVAFTIMFIGAALGALGKMLICTTTWLRLSECCSRSQECCLPHIRFLCCVHQREPPNHLRASMPCFAPDRQCSFMMRPLLIKYRALSKTQQICSKRLARLARRKTLSPEHTENRCCLRINGRRIAATAVPRFS